MPLTASTKEILLFTSFCTSICQLKMKCYCKKWYPNHSANTGLTSRSNLWDHSTAASKKKLTFKSNQAFYQESHN